MNRTMVVVADSDGDVLARLLLTKDQIRLLDWMKDNDCVNEDVHFQVLDDGVEPVTI